MGRNKVTAILLSICLLLSGCSGSSVGELVAGTEQEGAVQGESDHISYEVPAAVPNIFVDRLGYEPESSKVVIFRGENLPDVFTIRDVESREIVYTGTIQKKYEEEAEQEFNGYGTFSDFKKEGDYFIQTDIYGESYPFMIPDNLYYSLFLQCCEQLYALRSDEDQGTDGGWQMKETGADREVRGCLCIYQLLFSYELFPTVYTDDVGISESGNDIPDILDECRYEIEWLLKQMQDVRERKGTVNGYLAACLAKYAYLTKNMDAAFAEECLAGAEKAWKSVEKDLTVSDDLIALAAAELYRVTGSRQYLGLAEEYLQNSAEQEGRLSMPEFYAALTYMNTKSKVDVQLCDVLIRKVMEEAETISEKSGQNSFLIYAEDVNADRDTLLQEVLRIGAVNHIITNQEYNIVIENHFHYLMGRNPESIIHASLWEGQNINTEDIMDDPVQLSAFIFMLGELLGSQ